MVWEKYLKKCFDTYPEYNLDIMYKASGMGRPEFVRKIAEILFMEIEYKSSVAFETRKQLMNLHTKGMLMFH